MPNFFSWLASILSGAIIVWITQTITARREYKKKLADTNLALFMSWIPHIAEWYVEAISPTKVFDENSFLKKKFEILAILQILGPTQAILAFEAFSSVAQSGFKKDPTFNKDQLFKSFTDFNYSLCCEIHGEGLKETEFAKAVTKMLKEQKPKSR